MWAAKRKQIPDACMHAWHASEDPPLWKGEKEKLGMSVASAHAQGLKWALLLRAPRRTHPNHQSTLPPFTGQEKWNTATQAVLHALTVLIFAPLLLSDMVLFGPSFISPLVKGKRHCSSASITYHHHLGSSIPWPGRHVTLASAAYASRLHVIHPLLSSFLLVFHSRLTEKQTFGLVLALFRSCNRNLVSDEVVDELNSDGVSLYHRRSCTWFSSKPCTPCRGDDLVKDTALAAQLLVHRSEQRVNSDTERIHLSCTRQCQTEHKSVAYSTFQLSFSS